MRFKKPIGMQITINLITYIYLYPRVLLCIIYKYNCKFPDQANKNILKHSGDKCHLTQAHNLIGWSK